MPSRVHCLHEGRALCNIPGPPSIWPAGEVWLSKADWPHTDEQMEEVALRGGMLCIQCDLKTREVQHDR